MMVSQTLIGCIGDRGAGGHATGGKQPGAVRAGGAGVDTAILKLEEGVYGLVDGGTHIKGALRVLADGIHDAVNTYIDDRHSNCVTSVRVTAIAAGL